jgi:hypothetical protein
MNPHTRTIALTAGQSTTRCWWVRKDGGRPAANSPVCLHAIQNALRNSNRADIVVIHWIDEPDQSIPPEFHSLPWTAGDWLAIPPRG